MPTGARLAHSCTHAGPASSCLSTLEAVALALGELKGEPSRFEPMREAFRRMVDLQLACSQDGRRSPRHRRPAAEHHGPS